jgi:hypothetical protein
MENQTGGFDRANGQGQNHDTEGNIENVNNENIGPGAAGDDDAAIAKGDEPNVQDKPDDTRVETVVPDNDSGDIGPSTEEGATEDTSNKGQGPSGENL